MVGAVPPARLPLGQHPRREYEFYKTVALSSWNPVKIARSAPWHPARSKLLQSSAEKYWLLARIGPAPEALLTFIWPSGASKSGQNDVIFKIGPLKVLQESALLYNNFNLA